MKILNLVAALSLSSLGFGQYFNVYPEFIEQDSISNQVHYVVSGEEHFPDSGALYIDLLQNTENLEVVNSQIVDLSNVASSSAYTSLPNDEFSIDLGSHSQTDYIIHIWIIRDGEKINEVYLNN